MADGLPTYSHNGAFKDALKYSPYSYWGSEDAYGRGAHSEGPKPGYPTYDPSGSGDTLPSMSDNPWHDATYGASTAAGIANAPLTAPGWRKAATVPAAAPLVAYGVHKAYRAGQQINGDHPTQLNQQFWQSIVDQKYADEMQKNRLIQLGYGQR